MVNGRTVAAGFLTSSCSSFARAPTHHSDNSTGVRNAVQFPGLVLIDIASRAIP